MTARRHRRPNIGRRRKDVVCKKPPRRPEPGRRLEAIKPLAAGKDHTLDHVGHDRGETAVAVIVAYIVAAARRGTQAFTGVTPAARRDVRHDPPCAPPNPRGSAILLLPSNEASHVTGALLNLGGGR